MQISVRSTICELPVTTPAPTPVVPAPVPPTAVPALVEVPDGMHVHGTPIPAETMRIAFKYIWDHGNMGTDFSLETLGMITGLCPLQLSVAGHHLVNDGFIEVYTNAYDEKYAVLTLKGQEALLYLDFPTVEV